MAYAASKADIWRYAVLYTYGGMYIDDDSDMKTPLDEVRRSIKR
jgi:mannosyltransferase OCH1-like enzyme